MTGGAMRWSVLAVVGCSLACSGGGPGTLPVAPSKTATYFGFALGDPLPADAEHAVDWEGRAWRVHLISSDGVIDEIVASSQSPVDDVFQRADALCRTFAPDAPEYFGWSDPPELRYTFPFRQAVESRKAMAGCLSDDGRRVALAASDMTMVLIVDPSVTASTRMDASADLRSHTLPFAWRTSPHIGDPIDSGLLRFVVTSAVPTASVGSNPYLRANASPGALLVVVEYTVENVGTETTVASTGHLELHDQQGRTFRASTPATTAAAADRDLDLLLTELQPGIPRRQVVVFEIPESARDRIDLVVAGTTLPLTFRP